MLEENNVRKGFLIYDQYTLVRNALTEYLKPVLAMGYFTGMRQGEILPLRWEQVSLTDSQGLLFHDLRRTGGATWCAQGYPNASPWASPAIKPGRYLIVTIS